MKNKWSMQRNSTQQVSISAASRLLCSIEVAVCNCKPDQTCLYTCAAYLKYMGLAQHPL